MADVRALVDGIRERTAGLEIDSDGFGVGRGEHLFAIFEPGFGNLVVVVDNLPLVGNRFEKLANDLWEIYSKPGTIEENGIWMPIDRLTKRTLGFCFIVYNTPQEAETAKETTQNYMLYTSRKLSVSLFDDIEKCLMVPDERRPPETKKYVPGENLQKWLVGDEARGQFLIRSDADVKVLWNDAMHLKPISVYKRTVS